MYSYLLYLSIIIGTYYSRDILALHWNKWRRVNNLVSINTQNKILIIWYSLVIIFKIIWTSILQYTNNTVICVGKNKYEVSYVINHKLYKFHTQVQRGPVPILQIIDHDDNDVTRLVLPYMGPKFNGHTIASTPDILGYRSLLFEMSNGESYICEGTNDITIVPHIPDVEDESYICEGTNDITIVPHIPDVEDESYICEGTNDITIVPHIPDVEDESYICEGTNDITIVPPIPDVEDESYICEGTNDITIVPHIPDMEDESPTI